MGTDDAANDLDATPVPDAVADAVEVLSDGDAVLVRGPAMTGKFEFTLRALAALGDRGIAVSTDDNAESVRNRFAAHGDPDGLAVVDCVTRVHDSRVEDTDFVRYAASPQNLTEVGVKFTDLVETLRVQDPDRAAVGIHSLSTLLMYWPTAKIYQFARILLNQAQGCGWSVLAVLDDAATDEQTVNTLAQPFDAVVETRRTDEGHWEFKLSARDRPPTAWTRF